MKRKEDQINTSQYSCPLGKLDCALLRQVKELEERVVSLYEKTSIDHLTQLRNYRYFLHALKGELERTRRTGLPTALVMMDLDFFKRINDTYGHEAGNVVLSGVGKLIRSNIRAIDIACRYGGEEFALILPSTRLEHGVRMAERLRQSLRMHPFEFRGSHIPVTGSFGVDCYFSFEEAGVEEFIHRVDKFLILAKEKGRDRVEAPLDEARLKTEVSYEERAALFGKEVGVK